MPAADLSEKRAMCRVADSCRAAGDVRSPLRSCETMATRMMGGAGQSVCADGKFFALGGHKWYVKGFTYGPFAPNHAGEFLPSQKRLTADFAKIRELGSNSIRLYHAPPAWLLEEAIAAGLKVFIDVPWEKHRCFFEDWTSQRDARAAVRTVARESGTHRATFALSIANEIPKDIVRFYGVKRIERFVGELIDVARQEAPRCLATYTSYPSTSFLVPPGMDFLCYNVYLEDATRLAAYLDRLQHQAGSLPLILGEFGLDSLRNGPAAQARALSDHVRTVFDQGLAGSFVFSFTDDWFTGGHRVEDWGFGVTDRDRAEKPAALALRRVWSSMPKHADDAPPRVSVVICSYNGAATLTECLTSVTRLDYPDYEVILIDDGSTDHTPQIAAAFPGVRYIRQDNRGLSAARNSGAQAATGSIVAYTDSDCVVDDKWLHYLVTAMSRQKVDAIGGPNVPPPSDGWIAKCVAASPGGPSHVMLDDRFAEHVPGCNMAFDRRKLLELGGFDHQFRVAGDDVDICWRFLDAGLKIGYAPAALVWHHRRTSLGAYIKQQRGYGRSEGMLSFKHPQRFNTAGQARWAGIIYGDGAVGLPLSGNRVWHGRFGTALFQAIYPADRYSLWFVPTLLEWHMGTALLLATSLAWPPAALIAAALLLVSLVAAIRSAWRAPVPHAMPLRYRALVVLLHLIQPSVRATARYYYRLRRNRVPSVAIPSAEAANNVKRISLLQRDSYWHSAQGRGREELLPAIVDGARQADWNGIFDAEWETWDLMLLGGWWFRQYLRTASEELGSGKRFTRVRCSLKPTRLAKSMIGASCVLPMAAVLSGHMLLFAVAAGIAIGVVAAIAAARQLCWKAIAALIGRAAKEARLQPVKVTAPKTSPPVSLLESADEAEMVAG